MTQLIVGKWYDFRQEGSAYQTAAQYLRDDGTYFYYKGAIDGDGKYFITTNGNWYIPKEIKEFPIDELNKYLPKELQQHYSPEIY